MNRGPEGLSKLHFESFQSAPPLNFGRGPGELGLFAGAPTAEPGSPQVDLIAAGLSNLCEGLPWSCCSPAAKRSPALAPPHHGVWYAGPGYIQIRRSAGWPDRWICVKYGLLGDRNCTYPSVLSTGRPVDMYISRARMVQRQGQHPHWSSPGRRRLRPRASQWPRLWLPRRHR